MKFGSGLAVQKWQLFHTFMLEIDHGTIGGYFWTDYEQRGLKIVLNGDGGEQQIPPLDESYIVEPYRNCSYKYPSPNQMEDSLS